MTTAEILVYMGSVWLMMTSCILVGVSMSRGWLKRGMLGIFGFFVALATQAELFRF